MTQTTSSAEPLTLLRYSNATVFLDDSLAAEANRLRSALQHFEATCRESAFRLQVSSAADSLVQYAQQARRVDLWVRDVAVGFQLADGGGVYAPVIDGGGVMWGVSEAAAGGVVRGIADAGRRWVLEHGDEYTNDLERTQALLTYLYNFVDTPAERELLDYFISDFEKLVDYIKLIKDFKDLDKLDSIHGFNYPGEIIVYGGSKVKSLAGWSKGLPHLKIPETGSFSKLIFDHNVLKFSGQSALYEGREALLPSSKMGVAFAAIGLAFTASHNWDEYKEQGVQKVACGTVVDATLDTGLSTIGTVGGAYAGGVLLGAGLAAISGGTLAPIGIALGSKAGGFLGGIAGSWVADRIQETDFDEWATDQLDEGVDAANKFVANTVVKVEDALAPAVQNVSDWF